MNPEAVQAAARRLHQALTGTTVKWDDVSDATREEMTTLAAGDVAVVVEVGA